MLDVHTDEMVREAIHTVRRSRDSERVKAYTQAKGVETNQVGGGQGFDSDDNELQVLWDTPADRATIDGYRVYHSTVPGDYAGGAYVQVSGGAADGSPWGIECRFVQLRLSRQTADDL